MSIQLAPEVEAALRAEATARGVSVEVILTEAFKIYETQQKRAQIHSALTPLKDRSVEIAWTVHPDSRYGGEWVALEGSEVIAHGKDGRVVSACARSKNIASPFLFFVTEPDPTPFAGGWLPPISE
jgi:hypothetical protein